MITSRRSKHVEVHSSVEQYVWKYVLMILILLTYFFFEFITQLCGPVFPNQGSGETTQGASPEIVQ